MFETPSTVECQQLKLESCRNCKNARTI